MDQQQPFNPRKKRRFKNYLLNPRIQTRMGLFSLALAGLFVVCALAVLRFQFGLLVETIIELTDIPEEVREVVSSSLTSTYLQLGGLAFFFASVNILVSILYTHRLVGPTVAFRRHIRALISGNFKARTVLRKRDFFVEVANDLNELSQTLESREREERKKASEGDQRAAEQAPGA